MGRCRFSSRAIQDLDKIYRYIAADNPDAAQRLVESLEFTCKHLAEQPQMGRVINADRPHVRFFPTSDYIIYYRIVEGAIEIAHIRHGKRKQYPAFRIIFKR